MMERHQMHTRLIAALVIGLFLNAPMAQSAEIAHGGLRASVVREGSFYHVQVNHPAAYRTLEIETRLLILQDGLYAQADDGTLSLVAATRSVTDHDWQALKDQLESFTVEPPHVEDNITLAQRLAFRAGLDANPQTTVQNLRDKGLRFHDARDLTWTFSAGDPEHVARVTDAVHRLGNAVAEDQIRVAGNASKLLLGFIPADRKTAPSLFWPGDPAERLYLAPKSKSRRAFSNEAIGNRLLIGKPRWFEPSSMIRRDVIACLPFGGCGYVPAESVEPVQPLWLVFDRASLEPEALMMD
jgi:hypothetical protein